MKMKRIFALLLTFVMTVSAFGTVLAENTETPEQTTAETVITPLDTDEYKMLYAIGVISDELEDTDKSTVYRLAFQTCRLYIKRA